MYIISLLHALFASSLAFYSFFVSRSKYDYLILFIIFTISWCWTLHKGECFLSYYLKKFSDPSYEMGTIVNADDMYVIFGDQNKEYMKFFFTKICPVVQSINIYLLTKRNGFSDEVTVLFPVLYFTYYHISYLKSSLINTYFAIIFAYVLIHIFTRFISSE
uniref:Uncharacterized protein n=1 Tax=viral metagenome TaxID=1070528 RepID=A0A6C0HY58_9ZZZZ